MPKLVRLTIIRPLFITDPDADMDVVPSKSVVVPLDIWNKALALAAATGFRAPNRHLYPPQVSGLVHALRSALSEKAAATIGPRASSRFAVTDEVKEFLSRPAHAKHLTRLLNLLEVGGGLDVTDA